MILNVIMKKLCSIGWQFEAQKQLFEHCIIISMLRQKYLMQINQDHSTLISVPRNKLLKSDAKNNFGNKCTKHAITILTLFLINTINSCCTLNLKAIVYNLPLNYTPFSCSN